MRDETETGGFVGGNLARAERYLLGAREANHSREVLGKAAAGEQADPSVHIL